MLPKSSSFWPSERAVREHQDVGDQLMAILVFPYGGAVVDKHGTLPSSTL